MSSSLCSEPKLLQVSVLLMDPELSLEGLKEVPGFEPLTMMNDGNEDGAKVFMYRYTHPESGETMDVCQGAEGLMAYTESVAKTIAMCRDLKGSPVFNPVVRNRMYEVQFYEHMDLEQMKERMDMREPRVLPPTDTMKSPRYQYHVFGNSSHPRLAIELFDGERTRGGAWLYQDGRCMLFDFQEPLFADEFLDCIKTITCMTD
jgi:hypothetical protein